MRLDVADIKSMLIDGIEALAAELAPDGVRRGIEWSARNPSRCDRRRGSFVIRLGGPKAGSFVDYAADQKGDVIDLIAILRCGAVICPPTREQRVNAIVWAKRWLNIETATPQEIEKARVESLSRAREARAREEHERFRRRERARELFLAGHAIEGSLGEVYLASRGVELQRIANREASLRFAPRLASWGMDELHVGPAMLGIFRNARGSPTGLHATFLREDGKGKADLEKPKLMLGEVLGAAIRISKGRSGLTPEEGIAAKLRPEPLVITEGIEDGVTAALAASELRVWAVGSLGNIGHLAAMPTVSGYVICADNDWSKPTAMLAFDRALELLARHRRPIEVARSYIGKDLNDLLMRRAG
jgi:hypothetical protein